MFSKTVGRIPSPPLSQDNEISNFDLQTVTAFNAETVGEWEDIEKIILVVYVISQG